MRRAVLEMVLIAVLGSIVGFSYNALAPQKKKVPVTASKEERAASQGVQSLTLEEVRFYLDQQKGTVVVDARAPEEYGLGHIPNSINVPIEGFEAAFKKDSPVLKKASLVIIYCSGGSCNTSHEVASLLQKKGLTKLAVFSDGLPGWMKAKLPIKTGSEP